VESCCYELLGLAALRRKMQQAGGILASANRVQIGQLARQQTQTHFQCGKHD
jgi:hypothetical protein